MIAHMNPTAILLIEAYLAFGFACLLCDVQSDLRHADRYTVAHLLWCLPIILVWPFFIIDIVGFLSDMTVRWWQTRPIKRFTSIVLWERKVDAPKREGTSPSEY